MEKSGNCKKHVWRIAKETLIALLLPYILYWGSCDVTLALMNRRNVMIYPVFCLTNGFYVLIIPCKRGMQVHMIDISFITLK